MCKQIQSFDRNESSVWCSVCDAACDEQVLYRCVDQLDIEQVTEETYYYKRNVTDHGTFSGLAIVTPPLLLLTFRELCTFLNLNYAFCCRAYFKENSTLHILGIVTAV